MGWVHFMGELGLASSLLNISGKMVYQNIPEPPSREKPRGIALYFQSRADLASSAFDMEENSVARVAMLGMAEALIWSWRFEGRSGIGWYLFKGSFHSIFA